MPLCRINLSNPYFLASIVGILSEVLFFLNRTYLLPCEGETGQHEHFVVYGLKLGYAPTVNGNALTIHLIYRVIQKTFPAWHQGLGEDDVRKGIEALKAVNPA